MGKGKNRAPGYNRQSGGYQRNLQKQYMKQEGVDIPKAVDRKKFRLAIILVGVVLLVICILLYLGLKWVGLLIGLVIAAGVAAGVLVYLRRKQNTVLGFYKKMGMTEEMYLKEMKRRDPDPKHMEAYRKAWRKAK